MGLLEEMEETRKKLAEVQGQEVAEEEEVTEEAVEEQKQDEPAEETKVEEPQKEEEKPDNSAFAQMRIKAATAERQAAAALKRAEELEAKIQALMAGQKPVEQVKEQIPDRETNFDGHIEYKADKAEKTANEVKETLQKIVQKEQEERVYSQAIQEFNIIEDEFKAVVPDYNDVSQHLLRVMGASIKALNPTKPDALIVKDVEKKILEMAGNYVRQGLNPVEELYNLTKERYGYQPKQEQVVEEKPSMAKVAENRARNAGVAAAATHRGDPDLTLKSAASLTVEEYMQLTPDQKRRLGAGIV